ncbi:SIR2 family protein [Bacillus smithii]|uniref:SIR2 family protein n=1 Tax=Bacillus smithii TaxID=1479 RepID=UPI003D1A3492
MSLNTLIDIVSKKLSITKFQVVESIYNVINISGDRFNEIRYEDVKRLLDGNESLILDEMINLKVIKKMILCECLLTEDSEFIGEEDKICPKCRNSIRDNNHEVYDYYLLDRNEKEQIIFLLNSLAEEEYITEFTRGNFKDLIRKKDFIIPFIGSGVSIPLNLPSWGEMIRNLKSELEAPLIPAFTRYVDTGNYLKALSFLEENTLLDKELIKEKIVDEFEKIPKDVLYQNDNNYVDLYNMNSKFYITTNYDNLLTDYISKKEPSVSVAYTWKDIINMQNFLRENKKRVLHIHGHIQKTDTMIVTEEDYKNLYQNTSIKDNLLGIMGTNNLLFIGFSFNDEFFKMLYKDITSSIKGNHYILLPNVTMDKAKKIMEDAPGLRVIGLNIKTDCEGKYIQQDFVQAVRTVLKQLII